MGHGLCTVCVHRLFVCLSHLSTAAAACGGFAAAGPGGRRYRSAAARPASSSNGAGQQQRIAYAVSVLRRCVSDVCLHQGQRAWQQQSRAAAGDAHRRLHMTRGRVNFGPTNTVRRVATVLLRRSDCVGITDCVSTEGKAIGRVRLSVCFRCILF